MTLSELGAHSLMLDAPERKSIAHKLLRGDEHIVNYVRFGVCYDVVAYLRFLLDASIHPEEVISTNGQQWLEKFVFTDGDRQWTPGMNIEEGKAIGFYRHADGKFFHAAISAGDATNIRSVNGGRLGSGWMDVDLDAVLTDYNKDGSFNWDGTQIEVYISDV